MIEELKRKLVNENKNLIVNGDFASGKTKDVIFPIIDEKISNNESLIIYDTKDEYLTNYYRILTEKKYNIVILNYKDLDKSEAWNPLLYPYKLYKEGNEDKAIDYLEQIGKTIFYIEDSDPFWSDTAKDFFMGVCLALFEDAKEEEINLSSVAEIIKSFREQLGNSNYTCEYFNMMDQSSKAALLASATYLAPSATRASILSIATQKMMLLISRIKFNNLLSTTTINFGDCISKPTAIFILAPEQNYMRSMSLVFVSQMVKMLIDNKSKNKYNVVLEDIESVDYVEPLKEIIGNNLYENIRFYITSISLNELLKKYKNFDRTSLILSVLKNKFVLVDYNEKIEYDREENLGVLIDYPNIQVNKPSIFDLKSFVNKKRDEKIEKILNNRPIPINFTNSKYEANNIKNENVDNNEGKYCEMLDENKDIAKSNSSKIDDYAKLIDEKLAELEEKEKMQQFNKNITDNLDKEMADNLKNYEADFTDEFDDENYPEVDDNYEVDFNNNFDKENTSEADDNHEVNLKNVNDYVKLIDEKIAEFEEKEKQQQFNKNITDNLDKEMADDLKNYEADFTDEFDDENYHEVDDDYEVDFDKENTSKVDDNHEIDFNNSEYTLSDLVRMIDEKITKFEEEEKESLKPDNENNVENDENN